MNTSGQKPGRIEWTNAVQGDHDAWESLVGSLHVLVRRMTSGVQAADREDILQEALLRLWQAAAEGEMPANVAAFLAWKARVAVTAFFRRRGRPLPVTCSLAEAGDLATAEPGPTEATEQRELAQCAADAIERIPNPFHRAACQLRYLDAFGVAPAEPVTAPAATIRTWVRRGLASARSMLGACAA